jgi:serine/threonine protein phosphatase PrpC
MGCGSSKLASVDGQKDGQWSSESHDTTKQQHQLLGTPIRLGRLSIQGQFNQYESMSEAKKEETQGRGRVQCGGGVVEYAYVTQRGHYPDQPHKANQDAVMVRTEFGGKRKDRHMFAVFDGHGETGAECALFCKTTLPGAVLGDMGLLDSKPEEALDKALLFVNSELHRSLFDDSLSGTTACVVLLDGDRIVVSNVGDSRAVLGKKGQGGGLVAEDLSHDQTPFRDDEVERVKKMGARVLTLDQMEGVKDPEVKCWTVESECDGDPPRLWVKDGYYPGTAFTRSLGDSVAESIGVTAEAEHVVHQIQKDEDVYVILATDGVWEFIPSQKAVDMVSKHTDMFEAVEELASESYRLWLQFERRTDDISVILLKFSPMLT